jgi:hypothetical protein
MRRLTLLPIFLLSILLLLTSCDPGSPTPDPNSGQHVTDSVPKPGPGDNERPRPWSAKENLLDPNAFDGIPDPMYTYLIPFSSEYIKRTGIAQIEIKGYSDEDNANLEGSAAENGLTLSRKKKFDFDSNGNMSEFTQEAGIHKGEVNYYFHAKYVNGANGRLQSIDIDERNMDVPSVHSLKFAYDAKDRVISKEDPKSVSTYMGYDEAKGRTYYLFKYPKASPEVYVVGKMGDFPDSVCLALQDEILSVESPFVQYRKAGGGVKNIAFLEQDGRKFVREVHMGANGKIGSYVDRTYRPDENIGEQKFNWDDEQANFRWRARYKYTPSGDLTEMFYQKQPFNEDLVNEIDRYTYGDLGIIQKHIRSTRANQGVEEVLWLEFYTYTHAIPTAKGENAQPSGTR